ncbi:hypothetical protein EWS92_21450 [Vibrio vulnificus]|nr:hypothetical protein [Vibrio vulnificus]EGR0799559.1 hypothetical protein [Vibrio vulnificus]EGR0817039.1 hypothetical protein [Vibrio vulnificus]EGR0828805.1 hypothetical protein [Vibrio vulnificus]EGR0849306.1 hypothetical protein [Vibrio vulnificus]
MTGRAVTQFQRIANSKGWTLVEIAKRWGKSERQLSRIAKAAEQRDMDAVNGLPDKNKTM